MVRASMGFFARAALAMLITRGAFAAPTEAPLGEAGLVALVPPPRIEADGRTPITLGYVVLDPTGEPVSGLEGTVLVEETKLPVEEKRPGVYEAVWTPVATTTGHPVAVELHLEGKRRALYEHVGQVTVAPAIPAPRNSLRPIRRDVGRLTSWDLRGSGSPAWACMTSTAGSGAPLPIASVSSPTGVTATSSMAGEVAWPPSSGGIDVRVRIAAP